jgi:hypothetical protein
MLEEGVRLPRSARPLARQCPLSRRVSGTDHFHNGFMKIPKEVVHFYNTRDVLPKCGGADDRKRVGKTCWPVPEVTQHLEQRIGNLGLSDDEENEVVEFMQTLSDGYCPIDPTH